MSSIIDFLIRVNSYTYSHLMDFSVSMPFPGSSNLQLASPAYSIWLGVFHLFRRFQLSVLVGTRSSSADWSPSPKTPAHDPTNSVHFEACLEETPKFERFPPNLIDYTTLRQERNKESNLVSHRSKSLIKSLCCDMMECWHYCKFTSNPNKKWRH